MPTAAFQDEIACFSLINSFHIINPRVSLHHCERFLMDLPSCFEIPATVIQSQLANTALSSKRALCSLGIQPLLGTKTTLISDE